MKDSCEPQGTQKHSTQQLDVQEIDLLLEGSQLKADWSLETA